MLTKGEIQSIDFSGNSCVVRMPLFEPASVLDKVCATARFAITPGDFDSYKVGDIVIVGFEEDMYHKPIILGKLYTGLKTEQSNIQNILDVCRGSINCENLIVSNNVTIPLSTKFISPEDKTKQPNTIENISDAISAINTNTNNISKNQEEIENLKEAQENNLSQEDACVGIWVNGKPIYRHIYDIDNINDLPAGTSFNRVQSIANLQFQNIWVNLTYTIQIGSHFSLNQYVTDSEEGDFWNTYIDTINKELHYRGKTPDNVSRFILVVEYTKE